MDVLPPSEAKADVAWIRLRFLTLAGEEAIRVELHGISVDTWVVEHIPSE